MADDPFGNDAYRALAAQVATGLADWTYVESAVTTLFQNLMRPTEPRKAYIIMNAVISFEARLKICHDLISIYESEGVNKYWKGLFNRLSRNSKKRNQIAHFALAPATPEDTEWLVVPFWTHEKAERSKIKQGLNLNAVKDLSRQFRILGDETNWFAFEVEPARQRFETNPAPIHHLDPLPQIEGDRSRVDSEPPPQSSPQ